MNKFIFAVTIAAGCLTLGFAADNAMAATLSGSVKDASGASIANVFVTAHNAARRTAETVLTDVGGHYDISKLFPGEYIVRARKQGFKDVNSNAVALSDESDELVDLRLQETAMKSWPGSVWLAGLPDEPMKAAFLTACTICHDMGAPIERGPHSVAGWEAVIHRMRTQADIYSVIIKMNDHELAQWLTRQEMGKTFASYELFDPKTNPVTSGRISEYEVGDVTSWAHDMAVEPATGIAWVGDYVKDELIRVDPRTGSQRAIPAPVKHAGMHTLNFDSDGYLWITFQLADMVARFDTRTEQWRIYGGFASGKRVHSFALDSLGNVFKDPDGHIWVSQFGGNRISSLDPVSGRVTEVNLPGHPSGKAYGIAVDSTNRVWYTKYSENIMGWVDPATGKGKEWTFAKPNSGPHRIHIDDDDNLWIPLSGYGTVLRHNTRSGEEHEYALPDPDTFPYVARYDRRSKRVWITGNGANSIYALDPASGQFTTFRMPSYLSYARMISIDYSTGDIWTALSSYPNNHAGRNYGILLRLHNAIGQVQP